MTGTDLVPLNGKKWLFEAMMEEADVDDFQEIDFRQYEDQLTSAQAKALLRELAYWLLYKSDGDNGLPYTDIAGHKIIASEYRWLLDIAGWKYKETAITRRHADKIAKQMWEDAFEGRTKFAAARFRDRMLQVDRLIPVAEQAILKGDLGAVDKFVALARLDMDATGYKAPTRYEFSADSAGEITEADKQKASEAIDDARKFEEELLGNIIEGVFEENEDTEEE